MIEKKVSWVQSEVYQNSTNSFSIWPSILGEFSNYDPDNWLPLRGGSTVVSPYNLIGWLLLASLVLYLRKSCASSKMTKWQQVAMCSRVVAPIHMHRPADYCATQMCIQVCFTIKASKCVVGTHTANGEIQPMMPRAEGQPPLKGQGSRYTMSGSTLLCY